MDRSARSRQRKPAVARRFDSKALRLAQATWLSLGGPLALDLLARSLYGDRRGLCESRIDPASYSDAENFRRDYLAVSLMSKFPSWDLGFDRDAVALSSFKDAEGRCSAANKRLRVNYVNGLYSRITPESILWSARLKIAHLLGPFSWDDAEALCCFGPGATTTRPHREGDAYYKYREKPGVTQSCAILAYTAIRRVPRWYHHVVSLTGESLEDFEKQPLDMRLCKMFSFQKGNRVTFVPKDAKKNRTIAIEPTMNGFLQHGIGRLLRRRLRRATVGGSDTRRIDLDDQRLNQELCREASVSGELATVDLSAASDSVCIELVRSLLPPDWFEAIALTRSEVGVLPDHSEVRYEKVSSMGNGFTFELESLIFWALGRAVVDLLCLRDRRVSVYGDDIIIPVGAWPTLHWILDFCGFQCNEEKSFVEGPFRESCGKHYFRGCDVTPIYIRKDVDTIPRIFWFANQIRRWSRLTWGLDGSMEPAYLEAVNLLPEKLRRPTIPDGLGDFALFGDFTEVLPRRADYQHDGWYAQMWIPECKTGPRDGDPYLLRQLSGGDHLSVRHWTDGLFYDDWFKNWVKYVDVKGGVPIPSRDQRWRFLKKVPVRRWGSFGPWLHAIT